MSCPSALRLTLMSPLPSLTLQSNLIISLLCTFQPTLHILTHPCSRLILTLHSPTYLYTLYISLSLYTHYFHSYYYLSSSYPSSHHIHPNPTVSYLSLPYPSPPVPILHFLTNSYPTPPYLPTPDAHLPNSTLSYTSLPILTLHSHYPTLPPHLPTLGPLAATILTRVAGQKARVGRSQVGNEIITRGVN